MMPEFNPLPPNDANDPDQANRFEGARFDGAAAVPRSHTTPSASQLWAAADGGFQESQTAGNSDAVRDVSIEALLYRLDEALAAIRSLDELPAAEGLAREGEEDLENLSRDD